MTSRVRSRSLADLPLVAYRTDARSPILRPAPTTRAWMDATPLGFAYRCLPLNLANAHGWELLTACAFRAIWYGGDRIDAVRIECKSEPPMAPVSHFGSGVLTFHVPYLFRTAPGLNLWISGPPNRPKDGIAPLTGLVETDWSPYGFTMNWRFTRTDYSVSFEEGEPFCFFFPVPRGLVEACAPEVHPITDAPELAAQNRAFHESRARFLKDLPIDKSDANKERWQKAYYRGLFPDGSPGQAGHQIKLDVRPFRDSSDGR